MPLETILGCCAVLASLAVMALLVLRCRQIINRIARRGPRSARQTLKELNGPR